MTSAPLAGDSNPCQSRPLSEMENAVDQLSAGFQQRLTNLKTTAVARAARTNIFPALTMSHHFSTGCSWAPETATCETAK